RVDAFISEFGACRFLITSRIVGYRQNQLSGNLVHATLRDFDVPQIRQFLQNWHRAIETEADGDLTEADQQAGRLGNAVSASPGIRKLAGNPLLLTIVALANWRGTRLPSRRVELYQIATETLIENWPLKQRGLTLNSEEIVAILEPIAFKMFSSGKEN